MSATFLVLRTNDTSVQLFFHDSLNIDSTGLGSLPTASLEDLTAVAGARTNVKHNNRIFTFLDMVFVIQDSKIFVSTDEAATFAVDFTFTGASANTWEFQCLAPVPVMVSGALKLIGFYLSGSDIFVFEYDVATDTWSDADTGVNVGGSQTAGMTIPVVYQGLVYARVGDTFIAYDPVSTGTVTVTNNGLTNFGADQMLVWNGDLWLGPVSDVGVNVGMAKLAGGAWDLSTGGSDFGVGAAVSTSSKAGVFIDPNTGNLIVMTRTTSGFVVHRVTSGLVVTDITASVVGTALATLGATGTDVRIWPHITRSPGGNYTVEIYAAGAPGTSDAIQRFTWVDDTTDFTEVGIVGGSGDMAFPYAIHGGDQYGFFADERRVFQTAQVNSSTGITVTFEAYQNGGTTISVRGHYDKTGADPNSLTLDPMTLSNPTGSGGLSLSGVNPGQQIDGVPVNRTAISFDWDQATDGFITGDNYTYQLEAL